MKKKTVREARKREQDTARLRRIEAVRAIYDIMDKPKNKKHPSMEKGGLRRD